MPNLLSSALSVEHRAREEREALRYAYDDRVKPFQRTVVSRIKELDSRVFFRWNRYQSRWEIWRWRQSFRIPTRPLSLRPEDIAIRARFQGSAPFVDHRLYRIMKSADLTRIGNGGMDPDTLIDEYDRRERDIEAKAEAAGTQKIRDWVDDVDGVHGTIRNMRSEIS